MNTKYRTIRILLFAFIAAVLFSCTGQKQSSSTTGKEKMSNAFRYQYDSLMEVLPREEAVLLERLYEMMPLEDKLDYTPAFHFKILKATLKAKREVAWGDSVPQKLFTYFVMPERVNNENLDTGRIFFYRQLKDRLQGMSMLDAAMEINHYCHEHVSYRASDERTSSPLTTYRNAYGRCGEESVFVVSVLRSMCIPARQVYTPRWAHTDDNHAWVEFWAGGKWYYFGATEPAPQPNMGWFTEPARRAMLVGTRVAGNYRGDERINYKTGGFTIINTTPVYAPTKEVFVRVNDMNGRPVVAAKVDFQIYNYGEFYTLGPKKTDAEGMASFLTGYGDMLVWATDGTDFGFAELDVRSVDTLTLTLDKKYGYRSIWDFDYNPPVKPEPLVVSQRDAVKNKRRLQYEDSLRKAYEKTFPDSLAIANFAGRYAYGFEDIYRALTKSRGNWREIENFLASVPENRKSDAVTLLNVVAEKDLHDVKASVLEDHLLNTLPYDSTVYTCEAEIWKKYILNPRVEYEMLMPYRSYLISMLKSKGISTPEQLFNFMKDSLKIDTTNYSHVPISARGVFESGFTDEVSRDLIFVEACRSLGVAARLEPGSLIPQFYAEGEWHRADFAKKQGKDAANGKGFLHMIYPEGAALKYYKHFTIAKYSDGAFYTLAYDWDKPIGDFPEKLELDTGYYRITTGNRQADGSVLSELIFFEIEKDKTTDIEVRLRENSLSKKVVAKLDPKALIFDENRNACTITASKALIAVWLDPELEPSKHVVEDINKFASAFDKSGTQILLITKKKAESLDPQYFSHLPSTVKFKIDKDFAVLKGLQNQLNTNMIDHLPVVTIVEPDGNVVFLKTGYTIGIGEELAKILGL